MSQHVVTMLPSVLCYVECATLNYLQLKNYYFVSNFKIEHLRTSHGVVRTVLHPVGNQQVILQYILTFLKSEATIAATVQQRIWKPH